MSRAWLIGAGPGDIALLTIKASLTIGLGFRAGVSPLQIRTAIFAALGERSLQEVTCIATIDAKAQDPALLIFCADAAIPLVTFSARDIEVCFDTHPTLVRSSAVLEHIGVAGICEPCALLAARSDTLLVPKYALDGVTVAVACAPPPHSNRSNS